MVGVYFIYTAELQALVERVPVAESLSKMNILIYDKIWFFIKKKKKHILKHRIGRLAGLCSLEYMLYLIRIYG